jgi:hypothetical protein
MLTVRVHALEERNRLLDARLDSINAALTNHRSIEQFFDSALSDQAARFSLIITGLLALTGLLGYSGFRHEVSRLQRETRELFAAQEEKQREIDRRFKDTEGRVLMIGGNTARVVSDVYLTRKRPDEAFYHALHAASFHHKNYLLDSKKEKAKRIAIKNLRDASRYLRLLEQEPSLREKLRARLGPVKQLLIDLQEARDDELLNALAEIRIRLRDFFEDKPLKS